MQFINDKRRLESLVCKFPKQSKKIEQATEIINSHQKLMLSIATNIEQTKRDYKEQKLKELNDQIVTIGQHHILNSLQPNKPSKKKEVDSKIKIMKPKDLKVMKNEYLNDKVKREQLKKLIKVDPEEEFNKNLNSYTELKNIQLKNAPLSVVDYFKKSKRQENIKLKTICKAILALLYLKKEAAKSAIKNKEKQQTHIESTFSLHMRIARLWLLRSLQNGLTSVLLFITSIDSSER